jgi:hypothetical protein
VGVLDVINHDLRAIFIHVPKCAGSSVEHALFGTFEPRVPDYERLSGWCPERRIHLQHATPRQLLELELVTPETWRDYFTFSIVRNPFDRAVADYYWVMRNRHLVGTFSDYLTAAGPFRSVLAQACSYEYRGDHLVSQVSFLDTGDAAPLDFVGRFEDLDATEAALRSALGAPDLVLPHVNQSKRRFRHYSHFYRDAECDLVARRYAGDLDALGYSYEDRHGEWPGERMARQAFARADLLHRNARRSRNRRRSATYREASIAPGVGPLERADVG